MDRNIERQEGRERDGDSDVVGRLWMSIVTGKERLREKNILEDIYLALPCSATLNKFAPFSWNMGVMQCRRLECFT